MQESDKSQRRESGAKKARKLGRIKENGGVTFLFHHY